MLTIVDANVADIHRARRRGRSRSPETAQLIESIETLQSGRAKAIVAGAGETTAKLRARLMYAAKVSGIRLQVGVDGNRVLFARAPGRPRKRK